MKTLFPLLLILLLASGKWPPASHAQEGSSLILNRGQISSVAATSPTAYVAASGTNHVVPDRNQIQANGVAPDASYATTSTPAFPSLSPAAAQADAIGEASDAKTSRVAGPAITVTSSLAVVLGLFAALIWLTRKFGGRSTSQGTIPKDVLQNLGSVSIDPRTQVTMLRCGDRILIMARTSTGVHPLGEITNPEEVSSLTSACLGDSKQAFASALKSIESESNDPGYIGNESDSANARSRGRLFATA
ncbi:MAG: FliO/MopB family protein [Rubripirellula sp.]